MGIAGRACVLVYRRGGPRIGIRISVAGPCSISLISLARFSPTLHFYHQVLCGRPEFSERPWVIGGSFHGGSLAELLGGVGVNVGFL